MSDTPPDPAPIPNYLGPVRTASVPAPQTPAALTPDQLEAIQLAEQRWKKLSRATFAARLDGGITATFGVICLISFFCLGWENLVLGIAFAAIAFNSFRLARRLKEADLNAPASLAMNQLYLAGIIILYALYELHEGLTGKGSLSGQLGQLGGSVDVDGLQRLFTWIIYGGLIAGSVFAQGGAAIYYATRRKHLQAYVEQTPQWVVSFLATRP